MKNALNILILLALASGLFAQEDVKNTSQINDTNQSKDFGVNQQHSSNFRQDVLQDEGLYEGHSYNYYLDKYNDASKIRKTGKILIFSGLGASVTGLLLFGVGYAGSNADAGGYAWSGLFLFTSGILALNIGIPMDISGTIKRSNNRKAMDAGWPGRKPDQVMLNIGTTRDGIGLIVKL